MLPNRCAPFRLNAIKPVLESGYVVDSETDFDSLPRIVDLSSERLILGDKSSIAKYGAQRQLAGNEQRVFIRGDVTPRVACTTSFDPPNNSKLPIPMKILGQAVIKIGEVIVARSQRYFCRCICRLGHSKPARSEAR